jgi:hypothetical protein
VAAEIRKEISGAKHHVILSSEYFTPMGTEQFSELVASLNDLGEAQLVFFVRDQVSAMALGYN